MKKPKVKIDWIVAENEETWQASQTTTPIEVVSSPRRKQTLTLAILVTALLLLVGGWLWQQPVPAKVPPSTISSTVVREEDTLTDTIGLLDSSVQVESIQHLGGHVMARVIANYSEEGKVRPYRESRFYEKSGSEWQRIPADPSLLGPQKSLQIAHFTILYAAADADAVYESASKLEQLYAKVRDDFVMPAEDAAEDAAVAGTVWANSSYTIEIAAGGELGLFDIKASKRTIRVPSPSMLSAPAEFSAADLLYQSLVYPLATLILQESAAIQLRREQRYLIITPVRSALILWEFWDEGGPLTSGRDDIIRWVYRNNVDESGRQTLPLGYESICRTYLIWQATPWDTSIPLTCSQSDSSVPLPWTLPTLATNWTRPAARSVDYVVTESPFQTTLTLVTIIDYIVATYGREKLPELATALVENPNKEHLIPALFGCSVAEFEAGWQAYLAQRF